MTGLPVLRPSWGTQLSRLYGIPAGLDWLHLQSHYALSGSITRIPTNLITKTSRRKSARLDWMPPELTHKLRQSSAGAGRTASVWYLQNVENCLSADALNAIVPFLAAERTHRCR
jgi:hypothetical protein